MLVLALAGEDVSAGMLCFDIFVLMLVLMTLVKTGLNQCFLWRAQHIFHNIKAVQKENKARRRREIASHTAIRDEQRK